MSYGEPQFSSPGIYSVGVADTTSSSQMFCSMDAGMIGATDQEADAFFQRFIDYLSAMPGVTLQSAVKSLSARQDVTPTV